MKLQEQYIKEIMESIDNIKSAEVTPLLFESIIQNTLQQKRDAMIKPKFIWKIAASIALLIGLNIFTLINFTKTNKPQKSDIKSFAKEYFSYFNNPQF